jgi:hypothetical protein
MGQEIPGFVQGYLDAGYALVLVTASGGLRTFFIQKDGYSWMCAPKGVRAPHVFSCHKHPVTPQFIEASLIWLAKQQESEVP